MELFKVKTGQRDFFLYVFTLITLYVSIWRFITLLFEYVNVLFPDQLNPYYYASAHGTFRHSVATLIVTFPMYLGLSWFLRQDIIKNPQKREFHFRKLFIYLTLFLASLTAMIDLIFLINHYLNGELTLHFFLKVLIVFFVAGAVFSYYLFDLKRETTKKSKPSKVIASLAAVVVLASMVSGFFIFGSPQTQRMRRFDERRLNDLQVLQNQIVEHWRQKEKLPEALDNLKDDISGFLPPQDPTANTSYEYRKTGDLNFELCATFDLASQEESIKKSYSKPFQPYQPYGQNWDHEKGRACFSRTIDAALYRPKGLFVSPLPPL